MKEMENLAKMIVRDQGTKQFHLLSKEYEEIDSDNEPEDPLSFN